MRYREIHFIISQISDLTRENHWDNQYSSQTDFHSSWASLNETIQIWDFKIRQNPDIFRFTRQNHSDSARMSIINEILNVTNITPHQQISNWEGPCQT